MGGCGMSQRQEKSLVRDVTVKSAGLSGKLLLVGNSCFDSAEDSLDYHYGKHGEEVGATSREQYLRKAEEFARTAKKGSTKSQVDGGDERWDWCISLQLFLKTVMRISYRQTWIRYQFQIR